MEIVIATHNKNKFRELVNLLDGSPIRWRSLHEFPGLVPVEETGSTLIENAILKARYVADRLNKPSLSDDTGLFVDYLKGKPGVYSARFAGFGCTYEDNNRKLLNLLHGVPLFQRTATFKCAIALAIPFGKSYTVEGQCRGWISKDIRGKNGFGYDPVFIPWGQCVPVSLRKTYAQLTVEEKNRTSHRTRAVYKIRTLILKRYS